MIEVGLDDVDNNLNRWKIMCFTLGFYLIISNNQFNKLLNKTPQTLFFQHPRPLSRSGDFYVELSIMSNASEFNFLCDFTLFT